MPTILYPQQPTVAAMQTASPQSSTVPPTAASAIHTFVMSKLFFSFFFPSVGITPVQFVHVL